MNSRATGERSHRRRIRSCLAVSNLDGVIEDAHQRKQGSIGRRLIPVIENYVERRLEIDVCSKGTEGFEIRLPPAESLGANRRGDRRIRQIEQTGDALFLPLSG